MNIWVKRSLYILLTLFASNAFAQSISQSSTIQAQETAALCPSGPITDVLLTGIAVRTSGSTSQTGQATLKARAIGQSRVDIPFGTTRWSEIRINNALNPMYETLTSGQWITKAVHNSWVDANWFFPALSSLVVGPQNSFALGTASDSLHLFSEFQIASQRPQITTEIQMLGTVLYEIDPSTHLPTALHFFTHPDDDLNVNIVVDVQFSDYRLVNGIQVPFRIQRFINRVPELDLQIISATINPGLTDSDFAAN